MTGTPLPTGAGCASRHVSRQPVSLYVHVPFCVRKCRYCDFHSDAYDEEAADAFVDAVPREWELTCERFGLQRARIETVYLGGGTPSVLSARQTERLLRGLRGCARLEDVEEWTVECNPDSFTAEKARVWAALGVTRVSVGVQSLDSRMLRLLGRPHSASQALAVLDNRALALFDSVAADVIYAIPGQTMHMVEQTLNALVERQRIAHISAYELTYAKGTPLSRHRRAIPPPGDEESIEMLRGIVAMLGDAGFERYEISNYAKPGHRSRHNGCYWSHGPYVGLGPGAHSYLSPWRMANVPDIGVYLDRIGTGLPAVGWCEEVERGMLSRETIMLGLRTCEGIDTRHYRQVVGDPFETGERAASIASLVECGLMERRTSGVALTFDGMLMADAIARQLV